MRPKVLLHICCAPDATAVVERLTPEYEVLGFFHGPNIHPPEEYALRLAEARKVAQRLDFELASSDHSPADWHAAVRGLEAEPERGARCDACFRHNLMATAAKARELNIGIFTTTLTISPHKDAARVFTAGRAAAREHGVTFLEMDFKKRDGFKRSLDLSRDLGLYRQKYCGCLYSLPSPPQGEGTVGKKDHAGTP